MVGRSQDALQLGRDGSRPQHARRCVTVRRSASETVCFQVLSLRHDLGLWHCSRFRVSAVGIPPLFPGLCRTDLGVRFHRDGWAHKFRCSASERLDGSVPWYGGLRNGFIGAQPVGRLTRLGAHDPLRGVEEALAARRLSGPANQGSYRLFRRLTAWVGRVEVLDVKAVERPVNGKSPVCASSWIGWRRSQKGSGPSPTRPRRRADFRKK